MELRELAAYAGLLTVVSGSALAETSGTEGRPPQLSYGDPIQYQSITLVPIMTDDPGPFSKYTLLERGIADKSFDVREIAGRSEQATVAAVEVRNRGPHPVFLLGGEMILGGKQDRIIQSDTVVPRDGKWHRVAVFCVEQGRWSGGEMDFSSAGAIAHLKLQEAALTGDQGKVWQEVARKNAEHGTTSQTETYRRTVQNAELRGRIAKHREALERMMPSKPVAGVVFAINGVIQVADVFGNPVLFADLREKLLSSYILEAIEHRVDPQAKPLDAKRGKDFLEEARAAPPMSTTISGRAKSVKKQSSSSQANETVDVDTGKSVRSTYMNKQK